MDADPENTQQSKDPGPSFTALNEHIRLRETSIIIRFPGPRSVLSTSWLNGGYRENLTAVFNHQISLTACEACHSGLDVKAYLEGVAWSLSLDPGTSTGLVTRADMKNAAEVTESFRDLTVTAIVTAGVDKNGVRVGDPASYYESGGRFEAARGTINIIVIVNTHLPEFAMNRALITATEAKTAVLQELMAPSTSSPGVATGSGTDIVCIISDPSSGISLTDAGTHSKLGELIGKVVMHATRVALERETGLSPRSQCNALFRLSRFGVTEDDIWNHVYNRLPKGTRDQIPKEGFCRNLRDIARDPEFTAYTTAILHLVDEVGWHLLPQYAAYNVANSMIYEGIDFPSHCHNNEGLKGTVLSSLGIAIYSLAIQGRYMETRFREKKLYS